MLSACENIPGALSDWLAAVNRAIRLAAQTGDPFTCTTAREALQSITRTFVTRSPDIPLIINDLVSDGDYSVPVRVYHPVPTEPLPVIVFVHGGGHMAGSVSVYDPIARRLADATRHLVVSVDYRLAPECPFPAGLNDVVNVIRGIRPVLANRGCLFDPRLFLVGDSGGGALCASAAHRLQHQPELCLAGQVLIYPSLDYTLSLPSTLRLAQGFLLERDRIQWYFDQYFQRAEDRRAASPLFMPIDGHLPRTLVMTAEYCPLRDEGQAYVERLAGAGVAAEHEMFEGQIHAFLNLQDLVPLACDEAYRRISRFLG
jgi:acetyl esterase/lipase